jgi:hypothetical protein
MITDVTRGTRPFVPLDPAGAVCHGTSGYVRLTLNLGVHTICSNALANALFHRFPRIDYTLVLQTKNPMLYQRIHPQRHLALHR